MSLTYQLSDAQADEVYRIANDETLDLPARLEALADITETVAEENDVYAKKRLADDMGRHEVVGTGMDSMSLETVLAHLAEFAAFDEQFETPQFGGSEPLLDDLSSEQRFDHAAYYALQELYGRAIYGRMDTVDLVQRD